MTDYPDWQTFPNAQSDNLFAQYNATLAPGTYSTAVLPALSWSSIMIATSASAGAGQIQLNHYADAAATQQIDSDNWPFNANTGLRVRSPLRGKFVRIDIIVTSAVSLVGEFWANFLSASSDRISFPVSQQNLSDFDHSLPASGTATYDIGEIVGGQAFFYVKPYDATGKLAVAMFVVDELGNPGQLICDFGTPTAIVRQQLAIPDKIVRVEIDNNDGTAAHSYDFSLTVPPQ
jgi:hypothetical protein